MIQSIEEAIAGVQPGALGVLTQFLLNLLKQTVRGSKVSFDYLCGELLNEIIEDIIISEKYKILAY